jgi:hypothetical protein
MMEQPNDKYDIDLELAAHYKHNLTFPGYWKELPDFKYEFNTLKSLYERSKPLYLAKYPSLTESDFIDRVQSFYKGELWHEENLPYVEQDIRKKVHLRNFLEFVLSQKKNPHKGTHP